jgi:DNA-binding NtrC family response regulator
MTAAGGGQILSRVKVLIVEDSFIVADLFRIHLLRHGATVIGPAASVERALALIASDSPDAAVLDVDLGGVLVTPVAQALCAAGTPFVFVTALGTLDPLPPELRDYPRLEKPGGVGKLVPTIAALLGR